MADEPRRPLLQRLPGAECDVGGISSAGLSAGVVNILTEAIYPLIAVFWVTCPVRLVAFSVCALVTARGTYEEGSRMKRLTSWVFVTLCLYAAALGVNKVTSEVKTDLVQRAAASVVRPWQEQEKPRRPGDPW